MDERRTAMEPMRGSNHGPSATEAAGETVLTRARVVHAAAALYLGLGSRELRGILDLGLSLADVAEWQGRSEEGLKQALLNALGRTGDHHARGRAALVDQLAEAALEGADAWQELVENLITAQERRERRPASTSA